MRTLQSTARAPVARRRIARLAVGLVGGAIVAACADPTTAPPARHAPLAAALGAPVVRITDLGAAGEAYAIGPGDRIVGAAGAGGGALHAAILDHGVLTDLGTLGGTNSEAYGINPRGQVVGRSETAAGTLRAFLWEGGVLTMLPLLPNGDASTYSVLSGAFDVSPAGDVVGYSETAILPWGPWQQQATLWRDGQPIDLEPQPGALSFAFAVNARGQVVGSTTGFGHGQRAFLLEDGVMRDLGTLGGAQSAAYDVNARGQVVGWSETASGERHPFLWEDGVMIDLGTLGGRANHQADAINARGQVVGWSTTAEGRIHAFLWDDGVLLDLGTLGGPHSAARDISESGLIVGSAQTSAGINRWAAWTVR